MQIMPKPIYCGLYKSFSSILTNLIVVVLVVVFPKRFHLFYTTPLKWLLYALEPRKQNILQTESEIPTENLNIT